MVLDTKTEMVKGDEPKEAPKPETKKMRACSRVKAETSKNDTPKNLTDDTAKQEIMVVEDAVQDSPADDESKSQGNKSKEKAKPSTRSLKSSKRATNSNSVKDDVKEIPSSTDIIDVTPSKRRSTRKVRNAPMMMPLRVTSRKTASKINYKEVEEDVLTIASDGSDSDVQFEKSVKRGRRGLRQSQNRGKPKGSDDEIECDGVYAASGRKRRQPALPARKKSSRKPSAKVNYKEGMKDEEPIELSDSESDKKPPANTKTKSSKEESESKEKVDEISEVREPEVTPEKSDGDKAITTSGDTEIKSVTPDEKEAVDSDADKPIKKKKMARK